MFIKFFFKSIVKNETHFSKLIPSKKKMDTIPIVVPIPFIPKSQSEHVFCVLAIGEDANKFIGAITGNIELFLSNSKTPQEVYLSNQQPEVSRKPLLYSQIKLKHNFHIFLHSHPANLTPDVVWICDKESKVSEHERVIFIRDLSNLERSGLSVNFTNNNPGDKLCSEFSGSFARTFIEKRVQPQVVAFQDYEQFVEPLKLLGITVSFTKTPVPDYYLLKLYLGGFHPQQPLDCIYSTTEKYGIRFLIQKIVDYLYSSQDWINIGSNFIQNVEVYFGEEITSTIREFSRDRTETLWNFQILKTTDLDKHLHKIRYLASLEFLLNSKVPTLDAHTLLMLCLAVKSIAFRIPIFLATKLDRKVLQWLKTLVPGRLFANIVNFYMSENGRPVEYPKFIPDTSEFGRAVSYSLVPLVDTVYFYPGKVLEYLIMRKNWEIINSEI